MTRTGARTKRLSRVKTCASVGSIGRVQDVHDVVCVFLLGRTPMRCVCSQGGDGVVDGDEACVPATVGGACDKLLYFSGRQLGLGESSKSVKEGSGGGGGYQGNSD